jgi:hypothetical protein
MSPGKEILEYSETRFEDTRHDICAIGKESGHTFAYSKEIGETND